MVNQTTQVLELGTKVKDGTAFLLSPGMITKTQVILGQKESGKTYCAGVFEEEMAENRLPFIVIDAMGAHIGIKEKYPVVIFGGMRADVPISYDLGREVANAIVNENVSAVLDVSQMNKTQQRHFVADVCDELYAINTSPRHIFLEEVQEFAPQTVQPSARASFNAIDVMVRLGRQKGLGITMISQRAALINKNILSQAGTFWLFRTVWKADVDTISALVGEVEGPELASEMRQDLPTQETGIAWVWSPQDLKLFKKVKIRERTTYHAGATPEMGEIRELQLVSTDTSALAESFQKMMEDQKEEEDQVATLKREIKSLQGQVDKMSAGEDLKTLLRKAIADDDPKGEAEVTAKMTEQMEFTTVELAEYKRNVRDLTARIERLNADHQDCEANSITIAELEELNHSYTEGIAQILQGLANLGITPTGITKVIEPNSGLPVDTDDIVQKVLARIPTSNGARVVTVAPVEALRDQFQNEAVDRIIDAVDGVSRESKRYLLWLIQLDGGMAAGALMEHFFGKKLSGGAYQKEMRFLKELETIGVAEARQGVGWMDTLRSAVWSKMAPYKPSDEAVEEVHNQIVAKMATAALP